MSEEELLATEEPAFRIDKYPHVQPGGRIEYAPWCMCEGKIDRTEENCPTCNAPATHPPCPCGWRYSSGLVHNDTDEFHRIQLPLIRMIDDVCKELQQLRGRVRRLESLIPPIDD